VTDGRADAPALSHARPWSVRTWLSLASLLVVLLMALPGSAEGATGPHIVRADGDCLRMRVTPGLSGSLITCLAEGTQVFALGETQDVDGLRWERVSAVGQTGWVAGIYIVPGTAPSTPVPTAAPTSIATAAPVPTGGTLNGSVAIEGGFSLVLWTGGRIETLLSVASGRGCAVRSVWVSRGGVLIAYIAGAPSFVNEVWNAQVGTGPLPETPLILVCAAGGGAAPAPAPQPGPVTPIPTPTPPPPSGGPGSSFPPGVPPGPAGNE
jgi:hypothetical protein